MELRCRIKVSQMQFRMLLFLILFNAFLTISKIELANRFMIPIVIICNINTLVLQRAPTYQKFISKKIQVYVLIQRRTLPSCFYYNISIVYLCLSGICACYYTCVEVRDILKELALCFYHVGSQDGTWVIRHGGMCFTHWAILPAFLSYFSISYWIYLSIQTVLKHLRWTRLRFMHSWKAWFWHFPLM